MTARTAANPDIRDGVEWFETPHGPENQCGRCGSSVEWRRCYNCEDGFSSHDCGEDCCVCLHPEPNVRCDVCHGDGGWYFCLSGESWCEAHPLPGREGVRPTYAGTDDE